ncbi:MAG: hypothetical protein SOU13_10295 [Eubacteriales bacterium]|nr:hypothetical protein [Eubacteriales bacterium]
MDELGENWVIVGEKWLQESDLEGDGGVLDTVCCFYFLSPEVLPSA